MPRTNPAIALIEYQKLTGNDHTVSISYYPKNAERWRLKRPAYRFTRLATDKEIMDYNTLECLECGESFVSLEPSDTCGRCDAKLHPEPIRREE